jgi:hypothetical protein
MRKNKTNWLSRMFGREAPSIKSPSPNPKATYPTSTPAVEQAIAKLSPAASLISKEPVNGAKAKVESESPGGEQELKQLAQYDTSSPQELLERMATKETDAEVRNQALAGLSDENLIGNVARRSVGSNTRIRALKKLTVGNHQDIFLAVAMEDLDERVAAEAVERVVSASHLAKIAGHAVLEATRVCTINRIQDQELLKQIASASGPAKIKIHAILRISDQRYLLACALEERDPEVCSAAICGLNDQAGLFEVVRKATDNQVAVCAVRKINDQGILQNIVGGSFPEAVQCAAMDRVQDPIAVNQFALTAPRVSVRTHAIQRLDTRSELTHIAKHEANESLRQVAIDRLWRLFSEECRQCLGTGRRVILGDGPRHRPVCAKEPCSFCHGSGRFLGPV